jgi:hypothetical protein
MRNVPRVWLILCLCCAPAVPAFAETNAVGVVAEYTPTTARIEVHRARTKQVMVLRIGGMVEAGDTFTLKPESGVAIHLSNGELRRYEGPGSFRVPTLGTLDKLGTLLDQISSYFDVEYRVQATAITRGNPGCETDSGAPEPIQVPVLGAAPRVVAGKRDLPLAWTGGCPPFAITVRAPQRVLTQRKDLNARQVKLAALDLPAGTYTVEIRDARGTRQSTNLIAVAKGPSFPPEIANDSSPLGVISRALWLGDQDSCAWRLDAFEQVRPLIRSGDPLAGQVGDVLLWHADARLLETKTPSSP